MRDKLTQYVGLLFAGAEGVEDIQQEILQNTLDRYDDLVAQGKSPEAAYRLAIAGIGDINEILGEQERPASRPAPAREPDEEWPIPQRKLLRAIAVGLFILSPGPLILLDELDVSDGIGVSLFLLIAAVATALLMLSGRKQEQPSPLFPERGANTLAKSLRLLIWVVSLAVYLVLSFATWAWHVTWLVFPIAWAVQGLVQAILELKGDSQ